MDALRIVREQFLELHGDAIGAGAEFSWRDLPRYELCETSAQLLTEGYKAWQPQERISPHSIEIFAPSLFSMVEERISPDEPDRVQMIAQEWIHGLLHLCLYADRVWVPDPAELLAWQVITPEDATSIAVHEPFVKDEEILFSTINAFKALQPLIDSGVICVYPAITCYKNGTAQELFGTVRGFNEKELREAWPDLYIAEGLSYARAFGASYTALYRDEHFALEKAARTIDDSLGHLDRKTLISLPEMSLPSFKYLDAENLVAVRSNESSFEDFRKLVRESTMKLTGGSDDPGFYREVEMIEKADLSPALAKLRRDLSGTGVLKERLSEFGIDFSAGVLSQSILKADVVEGFLSGAVSALAKALMKTLTKPCNARPAASVVFKFETGRDANPGLRGSFSALRTAISHRVTGEERRERLRKLNRHYTP